MFILFGIRTVKTLVRGGLTVRKNCGRCQFLSDMREHRLRKFFALFFIPVVPVSRGESILICSRCEAGFYPGPDDYFSAEAPHGGTRPPAETRAIISCSYCNSKLRIPAVLTNPIRVTCPYCKGKFDVERNG